MVLEVAHSHLWDPYLEFVGLGLTSSSRKKGKTNINAGDLGKQIFTLVVIELIFQ